MKMWCFRLNRQPFSFVHGNNSDIDAVGGGGGTIERKFSRQGEILHYQNFLIQSKTLDALLEKAEQVIRKLEVSDDTKYEPSHESKAVDQLRVDNDGRGNSSKEELRAYLRYAVTKDFHRVGFNCEEAVINKFVEDLILDQESKRLEEDNPKIEEN
jgi:hypothetical protein